MIILIFRWNFNPILVLFKQVLERDNSVIVYTFQSYISLIQANSEGTFDVLGV